MNETEIRDLCDRALVVARNACDHPKAAKYVHDYYNPTGNYAGATFTHLQPVVPDDVTATDLYAISLLQVNAGPLAGRRLLEPGDHRDKVLAALTDADLPADADLTTAGDPTWKAAETLYLAVRDALGARPWVTASKLCARKRPRFFPVRDNVATRLVLRGGTDYLADWHMYRHLLRDPDLSGALADIADQARALAEIADQARALPGNVTIDDPPIRILDVVLWMTAPADLRRRR